MTVDSPPASPGRTGRWRGRLALGLALAAAGVALGLAGTWLTLKSARATFGQAAGPWRVSLLAGSPDADLVTRARVAVGGLLALDRRETLYYDHSIGSSDGRCVQRAGT